MAKATAAPVSTDPPADAKPSINEVELSAFDAGIAAADAGEKPPVDTPPNPNDPPELADGDAVVADPALVADPAVVEDPAQPVVADPAKPVVADKSVDDEIKELGIVKPAADKRFRELRAQAKEGDELRAALKDAGVVLEDLSQLKPALASMYSRAQAADNFERAVIETGADDQQFGAALSYLQLRNSRDPVKMRQAFDAMAAEQAALAAELGVSVAAVDVLDAEPDLKERVMRGDLNRADAEETARLRRQVKLREQVDTQRTTQQTEAQAVDEANRAVAQLGAELFAAETARLANNEVAGKAVFQAKLKLIGPGIRLIQNELPPAKWKDAVRKLYNETQVQAPPAAPKVQVGHQPLRPSGTTGSSAVTKPSNDLDAFSMGVDAANARNGR